MAQVAKTAGAPTATASMAAARYANAAANVATVSQPAVEGAAASNSVSFNAAAYSFRDDRSNSFQDNQPPHQRMPALVAVAPSQTFAAILEARNAATGGGRNAPTTTGRGFSGLLSRAIYIYETNAKIIHGTAEFRGGTVSIRL